MFKRSSYPAVMISIPLLQLLSALSLHPIQRRLLDQQPLLLYLAQDPLIPQVELLHLNSIIMITTPLLPGLTTDLGCQAPYLLLCLGVPITPLPLRRIPSHPPPPCYPPAPDSPRGIPIPKKTKGSLTLRMSLEAWNLWRKLQETSTMSLFQ